jgi:hypothetical protein
MAACEMTLNAEHAPLLLSSSSVGGEKMRIGKTSTSSSYYAKVAVGAVALLTLAAAATKTEGGGKSAVLMLGGGSKRASSSSSSASAAKRKQHHEQKHRAASSSSSSSSSKKKSHHLPLGKKEKKKKEDENPICPQTYVRITDTNVKERDFEEGDLAYKLEYEDSTVECEQKCNEDAECVGFVDYSDKYPKYCQFKIAVDGDDMEDYIGRDSYKKLEATSYYVPHFNKWVPAQEATDEGAEHEKFVYQESAEECEEICTESETCDAYVDYKDANKPYCRFKTKDYVQSISDTPAKDLYSKKTCVPGQPVGKEVLEEFEEKLEEDEEEEEDGEEEEGEEECEECGDEEEDEDARLAAMKEEAIAKFLQHKKDTNAIKEAIAAAKAKEEQAKAPASTSSTKEGHSKKPMWVKVVDEDDDEEENIEENMEDHELKIKSGSSSKKKNKNGQEGEQSKISSSIKSKSKSARLAQSKLTNFGEIAKQDKKKNEALAYAKKLFEHEKKVKAELAEKKAREEAEAKAKAELEAKKAARKAKKEAEEKAKKEAEEKAAAEEKARLEEEEKKRLEEEEYKKNWASRWMANIEARTEKLTAKKEKKLEETSSLGSGFRSLVQNFYPRRMWDPSSTTTTTLLNSNSVDSASKPEQKQEPVAEKSDDRPSRDLSSDIAMRMSGK